MSTFLTLIEAIFASFTTVITGLAGGIKAAFMELIYVDPEATTLVLNPLFIFIAVFAGLALAMGVFYKIFSLIRGKMRG